MKISVKEFAFKVWGEEWQKNKMVLGDVQINVKDELGAIKNKSLLYSQDHCLSVRNYSQNVVDKILELNKLIEEETIDMYLTPVQAKEKRAAEMRKWNNESAESNTGKNEGKEHE